MYKIREFNILNKETGQYIPIEPKNMHYQKYLRWLAEGNEPEQIETEQEIQDRLKKEEESNIQQKIENRMKEMAIADLKSKGEIPPDYNVKEVSK